APDGPERGATTGELGPGPARRPEQPAVLPLLPHDVGHRRPDWQEPRRAGGAGGRLLAADLPDGPAPDGPDVPGIRVQLGPREEPPGRDDRPGQLHADDVPRPGQPGDA